MPFIDLPTGARLFYDDQGEGEACIVLHGFLGTARVQLGQVIDWLSPHYRVLGPTMRGYGQSLPKPRDYPYDFYHRDARDVLAFMDALGIEQAHIMGYSDGGEIALICAGMQPERFKSVVVWGAVGYFGPAMRPVAQRMYPADWMDEETRALNGITDANAVVLGWINAVKYMIDSGGDVSLSLADRISAPLLMMLGDGDTLNPEQYGRRYVERTARGRLVMIPDCGHPVHDQKWERFKQEVGAFLDENAS